MKIEPVRLLTLSASVLFTVSFVLYAVGVYYIETQVCKHVGPNLAVSGVALAVFAAGILAGRALLVRSAESWLSLGGAFVAIALLYVVMVVMASAGCLGV